MASNNTINLNAAERPITMEQGASVEVPFKLTRGGLPFNMSTFVDARIQVRRTFETAVILNATIANGKMVWVNKAVGEFKFVLTPTDTTSILFKKDEDGAIDGLYDLELQDIDGTVFKGCKGSFTINREVTR